MKPVIRVTEADRFGSVAGPLVIDALRARIDEVGSARLAVAGGRGPVPLFAWFVEHMGPHVAANTTLTWVDERHHDQVLAGPWQAWPTDSNRRATWEHWLSRVTVRPAELPLDAPGTLSEARQAVHAAFATRLAGIDVAVLGVGEDGHIASLFPNHAAWNDDSPIIAIDDAPKPPPERLTLSRRVLEEAFCVVLAAGAGKADAIARAFAGELPLGRLSPALAVWVLDPAAAAGLPADATRTPTA